MSTSVAYIPDPLWPQSLKISLWFWPVYVKMVIIIYANNEGLDEPEHLCSLRCSLTQYRELKKASDEEPHHWPYRVTDHTRLKDLKPQVAKVPFLRRRLIFVFPPPCAHTLWNLIENSLREHVHVWSWNPIIQLEWDFDRHRTVLICIAEPGLPLTSKIRKIKTSSNPNLEVRLMKLEQWNTKKISFFWFFEVL